ncbi:hypothetical protein D3C78_1752150 [compost metagenome]
MRVRQTTSAATPLSSHRCQAGTPVDWLPPASTQPVAMSSPTTTGAMPCLKARTSRRVRLRWPQRVAT